MNDTTLSLPLAEKTNIKEWGFENLDLKPVSNTHIDASIFVPIGAKNAIVLCDGNVVHQTTTNSITVSDSVSDIPKESNKLISLNKQNKNSVLSVSMSKNSKLEDPLHIVYIAKERSLVHQTELTLQSGAELEVIETFLSDTKVNANIITKVNLLPNSKLNASTISRLNGNSTIYYHRVTEVSNDASLETSNFIINDSNIVFEDFTYLIGKASEANVSTVAISDGSQKQNITVRIENLAPYSNGNIVNYGIVKDNAHLAFNGIGKIHKGMNGGDNQQETRVLNLSTTAEAIANPFLLIDEGDITAGHAATIGQIDEEQVYYLMSRGMSKQESEKLIVTGFLTPFVSKINNDSIKDQLFNNIEQKLG